MAPEVITSDSYSFPADVFSFAIFFYEILIDATPYADFKNNWDIPEFVVAGKRLPIPSTIPIELGSIITACWSQSETARPKFDRIQSMLEEFYANLEARTTPH